MNPPAHGRPAATSTAFHGPGPSMGHDRPTPSKRHGKAVSFSFRKMQLLRPVARRKAPESVRCSAHFYSPIPFFPSLKAHNTPFASIIPSERSSPAENPATSHPRGDRGFPCTGLPATSLSPPVSGRHDAPLSFPAPRLNGLFPSPCASAFHVRSEFRARTPAQDNNGLQRTAQES